MIQTAEEQIIDAKIKVKELILSFGEESFIFKKKIRYRATPHTPTKYINVVSVGELDKYELDELYLIAQILRGIKNKNK